MGRDSLSEILSVMLSLENRITQLEQHVIKSQEKQTLRSNEYGGYLNPYDCSRSLAKQELR